MSGDRPAGSGGLYCVGLTTLDVVQYATEPVRPVAKTVADRAWLGAGGPAANAAVCAAHLTGDATLVTALGPGPAAGLVRAELGARGVTVLDGAVPGHQLPVAVAVVSADGERTVVSPGARSGTVADPGLDQLAATARVILVDGHHPGFGERLRALMPPRGTPGRPLVVVDAGSVKPVVEDWLTDWVDVLAGSADYARGLGLSPEAACRRALRRGVGAALVTQGPDEVVWWCADGRSGTQRPPQVRARDSLGAGDAFHGALAAALTVPADRPLSRRLPAAIDAACQVAAAAVADPTARGWLTPQLRRRFGTACGTG